MRVLLLSFYYPPDIGPGPLRAHSIVKALLEVANGELHIDVLTTMPNRYYTLSAQVPAFEQTECVSIQRIPLPPHQSGMADQARAFVVFAHRVMKASRGKRWDVVVATSSRLMTAALSAWIARKVGAKLYLDIRDLFTDTMEDLLAKSGLRFVLPACRRLEQWTFQSSDRLNVVSAGFIPHIQQVVPHLTPRVFTNGIDDEFLKTDFSSPQTNASPLVVYAGNMGEGQGLHHIIPAIAKIQNGSVRFRLIGDGGRRKELVRLLTEQGMSIVEIIDPVPRSELLLHYREADLLFLHLNDFKAFHKVLPSKIFEYAATGKPILAGVAGYAAEFLREQVPGVAVFDPCDAEAMQSALSNLLAGPRMIDRTDFCQRYTRKSIMREMANDILTVPGIQR